MGFEASVNRLNDLHWGPFERMRPPKDADIDRRLFGQICVRSIAGIVVALVFVTPILLTLEPMLLLYRDFHRLPSPAFLWWFGRSVIRDIWWLPPAAAATFPLLWWPSVVCWNRRAARMRRQGADRPAADSLEGVWPPPPVRE